jgi:signal transduction histidine kinase
MTISDGSRINGGARGIARRLLPQGRDAVSVVEYLIILAVLVLLVVNRVDDLPDWRFFTSIACVIGILLLHIYQDNLKRHFDDQTQGNLILLSLIIVLALAATWLSQNSITIYFPAMISGMAFRLLHFSLASIVAVLVCTLWLVIASRFPYADEEIFSGYIYSLFLGAVMFSAIGVLVQRNNRKTKEAEQMAAELQQLNEALLESRRRDRQLAVVEERMQLARDIHDGLGHHLTALNVQLQVAQKLTEDASGDVQSVIAACLDEATAALEEVRRSVALMRASPLDSDTLETALNRLVDEVREISSFTIRMSVRGDPFELNRNTALTCYRLAQEGLTNVQKHSPDAERVEIALEYLHESLKMSLSDDGRGREDKDAVKGFGLIGLAERAEQLNGQFRAGPLETGGFALELTIPRENSDDTYPAGR